MSDSEVKPHDGRQMGETVHRVLGRLLSDGIREPDVRQLIEYVVKEPMLKEPHVYGLAAKQRLVTATAVYLRRFARDDSWRFLGAAYELQTRPLDLVWRKGRAIVSDEIKSGIPDFADGDDLDEQLEHQLREAIDHFGSKFAGIRVLLLTAPSQSFFVDRHGICNPLALGPA